MMLLEWYPPINSPQVRPWGLTHLRHNDLRRTQPIFAQHPTCTSVSIRQKWVVLIRFALTWSRSSFILCSFSFLGLQFNINSNYPYIEGLCLRVKDISGAIASGLLRYKLWGATWSDRGSKLFLGTLDLKSQDSLALECVWFPADPTFVV